MTTLTTASPGMTTGMSAPLPPRPASAAPAAGLTGADVVRIIRARMTMIIILTLFLFAVGTGVTLIFYFYYPNYSSTALIRVQSVHPVNVMEPLQRERVDPEEVLRLLQDQALLVKSPQVLQASLEDNDLRATEWYREALKDEKEKNEDPQDLLADIINASPVRDSNYVGVSVTWRVAKEVPILVNTIVEKYVQLINNLQRDSLRTMQQGTEKELQQARSAYESKQRDIEEFRANEEVLAKPGEESDEQVQTLLALVTELEVDMLGKKSQWEALQNVRPEDLPITPELQNAMLTDPAIYQLEQRLQQEDETHSALSARYGPNHRLVREARMRREQAGERAEGERATKILKYNSELIEQARRNFLEAQEQLLKLKDRLFQAQQEQRDRDMKRWRYDKMVDEGQLLKEQYQRILEQNNQLMMTLRMDKSVQIDVRSRAVTPRRRSQPKLEVWLPAAGVLSLGMAIGFAMLLELTDTSVRTPRDVTRQSIPVLGTIPVTDDDEIEIERVETASLDVPHSIVAEAFRNLRTNLFFCAPAEQQATVLVTSPSAGNGKTTVATNLAISIALSGRRVLLVDANFRRASLPKLFTGMPEEGLSNLLIGQGRVDDYVTSTTVPGLDVLGAGPIPPNPAELLGSGYLRDLMVDARARYDQIIFDGPPLLLVSDAMVLASVVDGVVIVCRYRDTSRGALQRSHSQLVSLGARILGAVLNGVETRAGGYFRKTYREFYEYQEADEEGEGVKRPKLDLAGAGAIQPSEEGAAATEEGLEYAEPMSDAEAASLPSEGIDMATPAPGDSWGAADLDEQIDRIGEEPSLGEPEDYRVADDIELEDEGDEGKSGR